MEVADRLKLHFEAGRSFSPSAPIDEKALFAGRIGQVGQILGAISQRGQHAVIFGERGVGKTSLANVLSPWLQAAGQQVFAARINCDGGDDFTSTWRKMFSEIEVISRTRRAGFEAHPDETPVPFSTTLPDRLAPDDVRKALTSVSSTALTVLIFDEFDRLESGDVQKLFADTIKSLSDHSVAATVLLVGVADTVDALIAQHHSVERALVQVPMKRMTRDELAEIVHKGLDRLGMTIDTEAQRNIVALSQGLPHYTHSLALHATRAALESDETNLRKEHVDAAVNKAVEGAQESIRSAYHKAIRSPRKQNLYADVLLACALADTDELAYFSAGAIREPLRKITGKNYEIASFAQHLANLCDATRGPILQRTGVKHRFMYRFSNPLMQPFVTMRGFSEKRIDRETLWSPRGDEAI